MTFQRNDLALAFYPPRRPEGMQALLQHLVRGFGADPCFIGYKGFLTNKSTNGLIAQQQNGSTIVIEHRFYGLSNPYPDLTVESLRVHTIQQAIDDMAYFAENVVLPMAGGDKVGPANAPWVMIGASYSGALTSWTMVECVSTDISAFLS
jgi:hypothetical protein